MELFCIAGTCSLAPHILLEEIGEPFTVKLLDRSASEQKAPAYLAINPSGKVPALRIDGRVITENVAIQAYLADRFPALGLAPVEPIARGQWLSYLAWLGGSVHEYFGSSGESVGEIGADRGVGVASAPGWSTRFARPPQRCGPSGDKPSAPAESG